MTNKTKVSIKRIVDIIHTSDLFDKEQKESLERSFYNVLYSKRIEIDDFDINSLNVNNDYNMRHILEQSRRIIHLYETHKRVSLEMNIKKDLILVLVKKLLDTDIRINAISLNKNLNKFERSLLKVKAEEQFRTLCFQNLDKYTNAS